ncbi:MAG: M13 family metallopeptidase [Chitinophagaceae bacterium]|nr:M13 family metallopeptidase [Chitinophagaceae bacterium]
MKLLKICLFTAGCMSLFSCKDNTTPEKMSTQPDIIATHIDSTVHPGDDFFEYANGGWLKRNQIPPSENGWGIFNLVADTNYMRIKKISEDASAVTAAAGTPSQQIGDFFFSGMDTSTIEAAGINPLKAELDQINRAATVADIVSMVAVMQKNGSSPLYAMYVAQDLKNSDKNMLYISQGGLGLPDRDYYFNTDQRTRNIRDEYQKHLLKVLTLISQDSIKAAAQAKSVFTIETEIAKVHKKLEELRDPYENYHKMGLSAMSKMTPALNWEATFSSLGIKADSVIVGQPAFNAKINQLLGSFPVDAWKAYLTWHLVTSFASYLSTQFDKENFHFYSEIMRGSKEQRPRWKRVLDAQENALGDALGQLFVKEYFPEKTKKRYEDLVEKIVESYREHIQKLDWMTDTTKQKALTKLNAITKKIGYPGKWKDYSQMKIDRKTYCRNIIASNIWHFKYEIAKLQKPVDRTEWGMTPQTYNAYYNPSNNEIVLPAAIFTSPGYRDEEVDDAVIYGYVGASTIGHELTHGFDDEGRQFDEKGNLQNWWSKADETNFKKRADLLVEQFNKYTVLDSLHPNGRATLGENIADLGGIVIALDAFKKTKQYQEGKMIAGLTPLQRYFMGYAYGWMQTRRPEMLATQLLTDVHAPLFVRVIAPMRNCDEWYTAFHVTPQHKQYRDSLSRVRIW